MLAQAPGRVHQLRPQLQQRPPTKSVHAVAVGGKGEHLVAQVGGVVGVQLLRQRPQVLAGQPQRLAQVLDDSLDRVRRNGPRQDGELRPELAMHSPDELVAETSGEVQVDVRQGVHVLGDEPLQGQVPSQGVHVADAYEIAHQQRHRRSPTPTRRPLLQGRLRVDQAALLHDPLRQQAYLPVEKEEARKAMALYQAELLGETRLHDGGDAAIAAHGGLPAEAFQEALRGVARWHVGLGQPVAQVRGQVELAPPSDGDGVGDCLWDMAEQPSHRLRRFEVQVVVGPDMGKGLVQGEVEPGGSQDVLEPVALRGVVVDVVGGDDVDAGVAGQREQVAVAGRVALEEVALQLDVDTIGPERLPPLPQQPLCSDAPSVLHQPRQRPVAAAGEEDEAAGVVDDERRVQARLTAVGGVGQGEQAAQVGVSLPRGSQQNDA